MRIFLLSRGYPSPEDLYNYPFVRDRAQAYQQMGHQVVVYVPKDGAHPNYEDIYGVKVIRGSYEDCLNHIIQFAPNCIAAHAITDDYWPVLSQVLTKIPIIGWIHGSEIESMAAFQVNEDRKSKALKTHKRRQAFWRRLGASWPRNLHLVFVSHTSHKAALKSLGMDLPGACCSVIHNPIDTDFYAAKEKRDEQRFNVISIRPFDNFARGTDLICQTILELSNHSLWPQFQITVVGDGPLHKDHTSALLDFENVSLHQRFLSRDEILEHHSKNGIFLIPTRHDTQGISRDEAMSSGLVPVTNAVAAIPEFTDLSCAALAEADDAIGLANAILEMARVPSLFQARSKAAAERVRAQSAKSKIIPQELALMERLSQAT